MIVTALKITVICGVKMVKLRQGEFNDALSNECDMTVDEPPSANDRCEVVERQLLYDKMDDSVETLSPAIASTKECSRKHKQFDRVQDEANSV